MYFDSVLLSDPTTTPQWRDAVKEFKTRSNLCQAIEQTSNKTAFTCEVTFGDSWLIIINNSLQFHLLCLPVVEQKTPQQHRGQQIYPRSIDTCVSKLSQKLWWPKLIKDGNSLEVSFSFHLLAPEIHLARPDSRQPWFSSAEKDCNEVCGSCSNLSYNNKISQPKQP